MSDKRRQQRRTKQKIHTYLPVKWKGDVNTGNIEPKKIVKQVDKWVACKAGYFPIDTKSTHRIILKRTEKWEKTTQSNIEINMKILGGVFAMIQILAYRARVSLNIDSRDRFLDF